MTQVENIETTQTFLFNISLNSLNIQISTGNNKNTYYDTNYFTLVYYATDAKRFNFVSCNFSTKTSNITSTNKYKTNGYVYCFHTTFYYITTMDTMRVQQWDFLLVRDLVLIELFMFMQGRDLRLILSLGFSLGSTTVFTSGSKPNI